MTDSGAARQTGRDLPRLGRNLLVAAIPLAIGAFFGYLTAYQASLPDLAGLASVLYFVLAALIIGLAALVGLVALVWPGGRGRSAGLLTLATAGLLGLGYLGGVVLTPVLGLDYRAPVTLQARGTATLRLEGQPSFTTEESASASCTSGRDSVEVQEVWAALGAVGRGTVQGQVTRTGSDLVSVTFEYREAGITHQGPEWTARDQTAELENGGASGHVAFKNAVLVEYATSSQDWPSALSGDLTWACEPWGTPSATYTEPPQPADATVELALTGVDWVPGPGDGSCEFAADASVKAVGYLSGRLQGARVAAWIDLPFGQHHVGQAVGISIRNYEPLPGREYGPAWEGTAVLSEIAPHNRDGRAAFDAIPAVDTVAQGLGPWPEGWPATLSGEVSWACEAAPPPPVKAKVELELRADDWVPGSKQGSCGFFGDGSVESVQAGPTWDFMGWLWSIWVELPSGQSHVGEAVGIYVRLYERERGHFPGWEGAAVLADIAARNLSGRAAFDDLPAVDSVALGYGPWPADLPRSLTGELRWECQ